MLVACCLLPRRQRRCQRRAPLLPCPGVLDRRGALGRHGLHPSAAFLATEALGAALASLHGTSGDASRRQARALVAAAAAAATTQATATQAAATQSSGGSGGGGGGGGGLCSPRHRRAVCLGVGVPLALALSGINIVSAYTGDIFALAGADPSTGFLGFATTQVYQNGLS